MGASINPNQGPHSGTPWHGVAHVLGACKAAYSSPSLSVISSDVLQLSKTYGKREVRVN